ncbi:3-hydroxybutyrate dehydrogenase [Acetobacter fallax]|uniref:3-hydroxybutyrate dehydrogenase n=1 Tax=Acetobacter fallax TaxID=1737473 RepID=A0ABX0KD74_9PROT|nr:3-hydroxybutyrate dehydrogenase [Acetobacter fallax]NHO33026.1 3-hydroxybutyrate dehydrogenase [Acetobacter fallax]NHO36606.1 3-hydroxybutyrate dehydrogenase [Acetobacter fallax]
MFLKGRIALVTGSTSGIGLACARALAGEGAALVLTGFGDPEAIEKERRALSDLSGAEALFFPADLSRPEDNTALIDTIRERYGSPDILIANAGIQHVEPIATFPAEKWDQILALNLSSPFHLMQAVLPHMTAKGWGRIITTASIHSVVASAFKCAYVAAKHGLVGLVKTAALEAAGSGVTVNAISPGYVWTPLVENQIPDTMKARGLTREQVLRDVILAAQPTGQFVTVEQIAALALFLCREEAAQMTGSNYMMDGGYTAR